MSAARGETSRTGRALRWILGLQIALAAVIAGSDVLERWPAAAPGRAPAGDPAMPVSPGDQTRRFEPSRLMTETPGAPGFPASGPVPRRLVWEAVVIDGSPGLAVSGTIAPGDAARLAEHLDGMAEPPAVISLHSPGGSVTDALAIGRRLREDGVSTLVGPDAACLSACPYAFAGGVERTADRDARIGVHQHYFGRNTYLPAFLAVADIQRGQAEVLTYLDEMGVDPMIVAKAMQTAPDDIYILLPEEIEDFGLATVVPEDAG